jgi:hypothetical protein
MFKELKHKKRIVFFFFLKCALFFLKMRKKLTLMIRIIIFFELIKIIFIINTMLLTLKIMNFKNMILTKIIHIYVIKNMNI